MARNGVLDEALQQVHHEAPSWRDLGRLSVRNSKWAGVGAAALALTTTMVLGVPSPASAGTLVCNSRSGIGKTCIKSAKSSGVWFFHMTYTNNSNYNQNTHIYLYRDAQPDSLTATSPADYLSPGQTQSWNYNVSSNGLACGKPFYAIGESYKAGATSYEDVFSPDTISCQ
jgi:hypothetical protein